MIQKHRLASALLTLVLAANLGCGLYVYSNSADGAAERRGYHAIQQFAKVIKLVRHQYVDETKVDYDSLLKGSLNGMLGSLDPFSSYIAKERFTDMNEETDGHFGGIGVILRMIDGKLVILAPQPDTPGARAGLKAGDKILAVDGEIIRNDDMQQAIGLIKGRPGTEVVLTIQREKPEVKTFDVTIERAVIQLPTVRGTRILDGGVGYVQLTQFGRQTGQELLKELDKLALQGMNGLVLDLRNNPGGLLDSAVEVSSIFLPPGELVVFTQGRHENQRYDHFSQQGRKFVRMPMVILINEGSASAAEIVSGCLKDYGRAMLLGEKTFGKGSVQNVIGLDDGSAIRLTTAYYYTPSKTVIHKNGIEPNVIVDIPQKDAVQLYAQRSRVEGVPPTEGEPEDIEDLQLQRAGQLVIGMSRLDPRDVAGIERLIAALEQKPEEPTSPSAVPDKEVAPTP
jgi:carboxyl-terminal processing protease